MHVYALREENQRTWTAPTAPLWFSFFNPVPVSTTSASSPMSDGCAPDEGWYSRQYGHSRSAGRHPAVFGCQTLTQLVDGSFGHPIAHHACRSHKHTRLTWWAAAATRARGGPTLTRETVCGRTIRNLREGTFWGSTGCNAASHRTIFSKWFSSIHF